MGSALRTVLALLAGIALLLTGHGLFVTLLGVRMVQEGFGTGTIGLIQSMYYLGFAAGTLVGGPVIERVGHIRTFAALAAVVASAALCHALLVDPWLWAALRAAAGFALVGMFMVTESWLNATATNAIRGGLFSVYLVLNYCALSVGQLLLNLGDPGDFQLFSLVAILMSLSLVPVTLSRTPGPSRTPVVDPTEVSRERLGLARLLRVSPLAVAGCLCAGLSNSAFYSLAPVYATAEGLDTQQISVFMGMTILCGLVLQWPVGRLSDRYDRRQVMLVIAALSAAVSTAIFALGPHGFTFVVTMTGIYVGLTFTLYGLSVAHANDFVRPEQFVATSAGLYLAFAVGASAGPALASLLIATLGPAGLYAHFAAVLSLLTAFTAWRMFRGARLPLAAQSGYVPRPETTPAVAELDPRAEGAAELRVGPEAREPGEEPAVTAPGARGPSSG